MKNVMIDTIILNIPNGNMNIWEQKDNWSPPIKDMNAAPSAYYGQHAFAKHTYNMPKNKGYYPRLTLISRWNNRLKRFEVVLKIEFSAPKLIFGNNIDELSDEDLSELVSTLQGKLSEMGIRIFKRHIENAIVAVVHFSKNIVITNHYTPSQVITVLQKLETSRQLQLNSKRFQNLGHAIYFDCGSYQIVIYDKVKDIRQTKRHSVDKDKVEEQQSLFDILTEDKVEILRMEVRIVKKQKLNSLLNQLGYPKNPTLKDIFSIDKSQKIIGSFWKLIISDKNRFLLLTQKDDYLTQIINMQKDSNVKLTMMETLGLAHALQFSTEKGLNELRNALETNYSTRSWYRFVKRDLIKLNEVKYNRKYKYIEDIETQLNSFVPYKVSNL